MDIKILLSKVDSPEKKQFWTYNKTKHAKSGVCSRRMNFRKQYLYIDIRVKDAGAIRVTECAFLVGQGLVERLR